MTTLAALAASAVDMTLQAGGFGLRPALAAGGQADDDVDAGIAQVERVGVALAAVADDGDGAALQVVEISVFFVIAFSHSKLQIIYERGSARPWPAGGNRRLQLQFLGFQRDRQRRRSG